ncbi:MAG: L,D-transpeptidase family protein [Stomatobaculum sp.]
MKKKNGKILFRAMIFGALLAAGSITAVKTVQAAEIIKTAGIARAVKKTETVPPAGEKRIRTDTLSFDVTRFVLPEDAKALVVTEGFAVNGGKSVYRSGYVENEALWNRARVTVFSKNASGAWEAKIQSAAVYGWGGMSNHRHSGDGTTPIGLWKADTAFGRAKAEEGFPAEYVQISLTARNQYWSDSTNRLMVNSDISAQNGEKLWADWAEEIYAYSLNSGFNKDCAQPGTGSALFLHCSKAGKPSTAGCVAMAPEAMKAILRLYAKGGLYVAQAPEGQFETVYAAYSESGAAAPGSFSAPERQLPETKTVVIE